MRGLRVRGLKVRGLKVRGVPVGLVEELDEVEHLDGRARGLEPLDDLDDAAGIGRDDGRRPRLADVRHLALLEPPRHLGLA